MSPSNSWLRWYFCLIITFLDFLAISIVIPLLPGLASEGGAQPGQWVWVVTANGIVLTLGPFAWGKILNRDNASAIIALTLLVKAICVVTLPISGLSWEWLIVNRVISGAMSGTTLAVQIWLVSRASGTHERARAIAHFSIACSLGVGFGALLAVPVVQAAESASDYVSATRGVLFAITAILVLLAGVAYFVLRAAAPDRAPIPVTEEISTHKERRYDALAVIALNTLARLAVYAFPIAILLTGEQHESLSLAAATLIIGLLAFFEIPSQFIVSPLIGKIGYRKASALLILLSAAGALILAFEISELSAVLAAMIFALAGGALQSVLSVYLTELRASMVPWWLGVAQGMGGVSRTIAPLLAATFFAYNAEMSFLVIALISIAGTPFILAMTDRSPPPPSRKS